MDINGLLNNKERNLSHNKNSHMDIILDQITLLEELKADSDNFKYISYCNNEIQIYKELLDYFDNSEKSKNYQSEKFKQ